MAPSTGRVKGSNRTSGDNNCSRLLRLGSIGSCSRFSASNRTDFDSTFSATIVLVIFAYLQLGLVPPYRIAVHRVHRGDRVWPPHSLTPGGAPSLVDTGGTDRVWPPHSLTAYTRQRLSPLRSVPTLRDRSSRDSVFPFLSALALRDRLSRDNVSPFLSALALRDRLSRDNASPLFQCPRT